MQLDRNELYKALQNEALARCRYELYAEIAHAEGLHYFAKILEETSRNELSHVREFMTILGLLGNTRTNLETAIMNEKDESTLVYPKLSEAAKVDGELNTARLLQQIGKIEERHSIRFEQLAKLLDEDSVYRREKKILWKCRTCGYIYEGLEPPKKCPGCQSSKECYEPADFSI